MFKLKKHIIMSLILILILNIYLLIGYKHLFKNFKSYFSSYDFVKANNTLILYQELNPYKKMFLKKDLTKYFNKLINTIPNKIENNQISNNEALNLITEINSYDFVYINTAPILDKLAYSDPYLHALSLYKSKQYIDAYNSFLTISINNSNYHNAVNYLHLCKNKIKKQIIRQSNNLCINNYYSKALELFDSVNNIIGKDNDIIKQISEIQKEKQEYIAKRNNGTLATTSAITQNISSENINILSIGSQTNYLIYVDLDGQKTYVYSGSKNNWNLIKTFMCSTGKNSEKTPEGIFTIESKGDWFYSEDYNQGAKYWLQFSGNYLFHSLPYNEDKTQIVDYTLGKPSSHGCIRLSLSDSKWLYDNISTNTKVIIN